MLYKRHHIMSDFFQSRTTEWKSMHEDELSCSPPQNPLLLFCDVILKYEKYKLHDEDFDDGTLSSGSSERTNDSFSLDAEEKFSKRTRKVKAEKDDSWDLITCYCMKPFKGRPMIECAACETWVHMSCAKVRPNNVPDVFLCQFCEQPKGSKRRSERIRSDDRRLLSA